MIRFFLFLSLPLYALDQLTKLLILLRFPEYPTRDHIVVIPDFFNLVRVHNTGMAFGMLNGSPYANLLFGGIAVVALGFIVVLWKKNAFPDKITKTAAGLLAAGILGNFTDRMLPGRGYVVDFLDFKLPLYDKIAPTSGGHFPSFNVADSCICVAAGLLILSAFRPQPEAAPGADRGEQTGAES